MTELELLRIHKEVAEALVAAHECRYEAMSMALNAILRVLEGAPHTKHCGAVIDGPDEVRCDCHVSRIRRLCIAAA